MTSPYANKDFQGKNLYARIFGKTFQVDAGANSLLFSIPFNAVKLFGADIIGGEIGDTCNFKVLDKAVNPIYGTPNALLNQFGFDVNLCSGTFSYASKFPADLIKDFQILIEYTSVSSKTIGVNYLMDELV